MSRSSRPQSVEASDVREYDRESGLDAVSMMLFLIW